MSTSVLLPSSGRLLALFPLLFYPPDRFVFLGHFSVIIWLYIFIITQPDVVKSVILTLKPATFFLKSCILDVIRCKAGVHHRFILVKWFFTAVLFNCCRSNVILISLPFIRIWNSHLHWYKRKCPPVNYNHKLITLEEEHWGRMKWWITSWVKSLLTAATNVRLTVGDLKVLQTVLSDQDKVSSIK